MYKLSTKKLFFYISLSLVICYFTFVLIAYNSGILKELYTLENISLYYMFSYVLLVAVGYIIDIGSRKEPGFLTLFFLPSCTLLFLLGMMLLANVMWTYILVMILVMLLVFILGYFCYNRWIEKILLIKNGYENILFLYIIIHLFIALFVVFKVLNIL